MVFSNFIVLERITIFLGRNDFCWQKNQCTIVLCPVTENILIWKHLLKRMDFCWKEINLFKLQKNFFWQEKYYSGKNSFCFERNKFYWQEISMLNSWREIFLSEVLILEGIYSAQEFNFFWQEINVLRSLKDFCRPILLFWKEFIFCWKNWFLLEINMLKSRKYFCWHFLFSVLQRIYFCPIWKIFLFQSKMRQKRVIFYQYFGSISKYFG